MGAIRALILTVLVNCMATAQSLQGNWAGPMTVTGNSGVGAQATLSLNVSGASLVGELMLRTTGLTDKYVLKGIINGQVAQGTATYPVDGSVFQFEAALQNQQLLFAIGQNSKVLMSGLLNRSGAGVGLKPVTDAAGALSVKPDGLYRDPNLVGAWRTESNYGGGVTDGGFYGSTSSTLILKADGTFGDGGSSGYASGSGVSVTSSGSANAQLYKQLEAAGARWFTKANVFYVRLTVNGKVQDVPSAEYYIENGKALLTDLKTGRKTLYYKTK